MKTQTVLTGDRPTGPLHLGHYVGSLKQRVELQEKHPTFILIADAQALTDNANDIDKIKKSIIEVALDYLAVGIDPAKSTIFIQSLIPELCELTTLYMNLVTVSQLEQNPTIKDEIKQRGFQRNIPVGFLNYPVSQAADITAFKGTLIPVGDDQLPMIEQSNDIVYKFNRDYKTDCLKKCKALLSSTPRLPGTDGKNKMSKSLNNAIYLSDSSDQIAKKIKTMYTDPKHLRIEDPGNVEGNPVFAYLDAFDQDQESLTELKAYYTRGGLGDGEVKKRLNATLQDFIAPIRVRREEFQKDIPAVMEILKLGTAKAREVAAITLMEVKTALGINYF